MNKFEFNKQIVVGSMENLEYSSLKDMVDRFGPRNVHPRLDSVHLRGSQGSKLFTECVIAAVKATAEISSRKPEGEYQTPKNTVKQRQEQEQVNPIPTQNMYDMLN